MIDLGVACWCSPQLRECWPSPPSQCPSPRRHTCRSVCTTIQPKNPMPIMCDLTNFKIAYSHIKALIYRPKHVGIKMDLAVGSVCDPGINLP